MQHARVRDQRCARRHCGVDRAAVVGDALVEYELTPLGQPLRGPLKALTEWSVQHIEDVLTARKKYPDRSGKH